VLAARRFDRLEALVARIERSGGTARSVRCDVTDPGQVRSLSSVVDRVFGPCDVLVNNAGVPGRGSFDHLEYGHIEKTVNVNVLGVMYGTRAFLPGMLERARGHIVNVGSLTGRYATPGAAVYSATKHAVVAFSEALDQSTRGRGVRVTVVNPGFVPTEGFPQRGRPSMLTFSADRVARDIVRIVEEGIAPELSIPRWAAAGQALRLLAPALYRRALRMSARFDGV
jgi:short-subunit dehydrogenase